MSRYIYTLVRHSHFTNGRDTCFAYGVESRSVPDDDVVEAAIRRAGGLVLPSYGVTDELGFKLMYGEDVKGLHPHVRGTFKAVTRADRRGTRLFDAWIYVLTPDDWVLVNAQRAVETLAQEG